MKPANALKRKRTRDDNDPVYSDDEGADSSCENTRPGQAERKRELERNRRNLINVRFAELDAELRTHVPKSEGLALSERQQAAAKSKRIDKEAVLKEATQRLAVHRNDMRALHDRLRANALEIENLRTEKAELRSDKAFLRSELGSIRGDVKRLRQDNINLWQALRKTSTLKNGLSDDVAKLPADLFLRPRSTQPSAQPQIPQADSNNAATPQHLQQPQQQTLATAAAAAAATAVAAAAGNQQQQATGTTTVTAAAQTNTAAPAAPAAAIPTATTPASGDTKPTEPQRSPGSLPVSAGARQDITQTPELQGPEAYLVLQSAEELGHLFSMATSAGIGASLNPIQHGAMQQQQQLQLNQPLRNQPSIAIVPPLISPSTGSFPCPLASPPLPAVHANKDTYAQRVIPTATPNLGVDPDDNSTSKSEEDPFSDIAYCV